VRYVQRYIVHIVVIGIIALSSLATVTPDPVTAAGSFRQEILVPFDTSTSQGRNQPIDIRILFEHPCWARDETNRSIRVISDNEGTTTELESQVYDLNFSQSEVVSACNVVFIIPSHATGTEHYYVTYSDAQTDAPHYPDHVSITEAYYYFAPIPGYPFQSRYYQITQDSKIIYGVASEGQFLGTSTAQQITLFKDNTTAVTTPTDGLAYASYDYFYFYGPNLMDFTSTIQHLLSKRILIDGNLMVACQITSQTNKADFQTTATYHYYYNPDPTNHRIYTHVHHQALKATQSTLIPPNSEASGNIASLQLGAMSSPSIAELNFGTLLPYLHLDTTTNQTLEKPLDLNPDYTPEGIRILSTTDDADLGPNAWISFDTGPTGTAYAMIVASTQILKSGTDEHNGIQIKAEEVAGPGLLGLKSGFQTFALCRNSYTTGGTNDNTVPADYAVEFDAEFYTTTTGGYTAVQNESHYYHTNLIAHPTNTTTNTTTPLTNPTRYHLTAYVRLAPTAPFGALFSLLTGKNFSYLTAELYHHNTMMASDVAGRLTLTTIPTIDNTTRLLQTIKTTLGAFDWKNLTATKKITFKDLEPGTYLIKIYKEHPRHGDRRFIGETIITLTKNTTTRIRCHPQAHLTILATDQHGHPITTITSSLQTGNITIATLQPTQDTTPTLTAPCSPRTPYQLTCYYDGFLIYNQPVHLGLITSLIPKKINMTIGLYNLEIIFQDTWGIPPPTTLSPTLTSNDMTIPQTLHAKQLDDGTYLFENLYPADYTLTVSYGTTLYQQHITIPQTGTEPLRITLPAAYTITMTTLDARGLILPQTTIKVSRGGNTTTLTDHNTGKYTVKLPPGNYTATIIKDNTIIGKRNITIISDRSVTLITTAEPLFPLLGLIGALAIAIIGIFFYLRKKDVMIFCVAIAIALALASMILPWWSQQGSSSTPTATSTTHLYLIPGSLITFATTGSAMAGDFASVPPIFTTFLTMLLGAITGGIILLCVYVFLLRNRPKKLPAIVLAGAGIFLLLAVGAFYAMMSVVSKVGVGGVIGSGTISCSLPGETTMVSLASSWGLDLGFYLCLGAAGICIFLLLLRWRMHQAS
jgi:hypothetical protein